MPKREELKEVKAIEWDEYLASKGLDNMAKGFALKDVLVGSLFCIPQLLVERLVKKELKGLHPESETATVFRRQYMDDFEWHDLFKIIAKDKGVYKYSHTAWAKKCFAAKNIRTGKMIFLNDWDCPTLYFDIDTVKM